MSKPKKPAAKPEPVANKDVEDARKVLREVMDTSDDDQAKVLAALGLIQLSRPSIH